MVNNAWHDEVEGVAEIRATIGYELFVPKLVDGHADKERERHIHDVPHELPYPFTVLQEVGSLLRVKVADLKEDLRLNEARDNQNCIVNL